MRHILKRGRKWNILRIASCRKNLKQDAELHRIAADTVPPNSLPPFPPSPTCHHGAQMPAVFVFGLLFVGDFTSKDGKLGAEPNSLKRLATATSLFPALPEQGSS